jgi:pilus assembly protein CpaB
MSRRVILLIAAVLIAALGATGVFLYVRNVETEAEAEQELVEVLVATQTVPAGQTAAEAEAAGSFALTEISAEAAAPGALSSIDPIRDLQALSPLYAGEQILEQKFGTLGSAVPIPIPEGRLAASVQLSDPARVAGFVAPGSEVAIFFTAVPPVAAEGEEGEATETDTFTTVLLPRVEVIGTGQTTVVSRTTTTEEGTQTTEDISLAILTLALTQEEAQQVVQAQTQGSLYFGLLTDTSETQRADPITTFEDLVTP